MFCCDLLNWWILFMNSSVLLLVWCKFWVWLNIFWRFVMLVKIVEMGINFRLVLCVSRWVIVVFFVFGGFYKIIELSWLLLIIWWIVLLLVRRWFCLIMLFNFCGCRWLVSGFGVVFLSLVVLKRLDMFLKVIR